ncbi:MAG: DinB family protein [Tepidiformaceae bacterium]
MTQMQALADSATATLNAFEAVLRSISDASLHQADPEGGWTVAQIVSHVHLSGILFIGDLERLRHHDQLFMFREELGHDAIGAPPPSSAEAAARIASLRLALADCLSSADDAELAKTVEVRPFGKLTIGVLAPGIVGHLAAHAEQAGAILRKRGAVT